MQGDTRGEAREPGAELGKPTAISEEVRRLLLVRRMRAVIAGNTLATAAALASAAVLVVGFDEAKWRAPLLSWAIIAALAFALRAYFFATLDPDENDGEALTRDYRRVTGWMIVTSALWAVGFVLFALIAQGLEIALLGVVGTAMLVGVLLIHRAVPFAGYVHIALLLSALIAAAWLSVGAQSLPITLVLVIYAIALWTAVGRMDAAFQAAIAADVEREEARATVAMLLNDYEEQSTDWLWIIDRHGNLREVTERFANACARDPETLEGSSILDLVEPGEGRDQLSQHIVNTHAFRDIAVSVSIDGAPRYWQLSARPRSDGSMSGVARDVTADRLIEERVTQMAHYDSLTNLANRYLFNERLRELLGDSRSSGANVALFYLDLDDFKAINDTRGHLVGDRLLREVAERLACEVRDEDTVARLGGDEFAVLIETRAGDGMLIERAHRFLSVVRAPYEIDGHSYKVSTSVGVARCHDGDCDAEELMRRADLALYAAKNKGRDNLAIFEHSLDQQARERRSLEADLGEALARDQLRLHFQPIIELETGQATGYEALLRWYHPERGVLGPSEFLSIAEETGLIMPIGDWVIRTALAETVDWAGDFRVAINLSTTQVADPRIVATLSQALRETDFPAHRVELEITEHVLMDQSDANRDTLLKMREMGLRIALDDFGTGFSSLAYLRRFPFDRIKIDRTFVRDLTSDIGSQAIVSTITRLAEAMDMETTAEGVEDRRQLDLLRKLGVKEAQGFLISKPLLAEKISATTIQAEEVAEAPVEKAVIDYRQARKAALKRRGGQAA